jgi:hypothetical protein
MDYVPAGIKRYLELLLFCRYSHCCVEGCRVSRSTKHEHKHTTAVLSIPKCRFVLVLILIRSSVQNFVWVSDFIQNEQQGGKSFWEVDSSSASHEIPRILCNPKVHHHIHIPSPKPAQSSPYSHIPLPEDPSYIIIPSMPRPFKWSLSLRSPHQNTLCIPPVSHSCHMHRPSYYSWFNHPNNISWAVQIIKQYRS